MEVNGMGTPKSRIERLHEILDTLEKNHGKTTFGKLFSNFALNYGTTKRTFRSYLETLKLTGKISYSTKILFQKKDETVIELI
jgi:hypothetical protein